VSIQVREAAIIADGNLGDVFVGKLRDERAQLLSQLQVRLELLNSSGETDGMLTALRTAPDCR